MLILSTSSARYRIVADRPTLYLPWASGTQKCVTQAPHGYVSTAGCPSDSIADPHASHYKGTDYEAWDFGFTLGTEVLAAAQGKVVSVVNDFTQSTWNDNLKKCVGRTGQGPFQANQVVIEHGSGTYTIYLHLQQTNSGKKNDNGYVKVGDSVRRGRPIGLSGTTGCSSGPHLHFALTNSYFGDGSGGQSIAASFADSSIRDDDGKPKAGKKYKSENDPTTDDGTSLPPSRDNKAPAITFTALPAVNRWYNNKPPQKLAWLISDNEGVSGCRWKLSIGAYKDPSVRAPDPACSANGSVGIGEAGQGQIFLTLWAFDKAGNRGEAKKGWWGFDTDDPTGNWAQPPNGFVVGSANAVALEANAADTLSGVSAVQFRARYGGQWHDLARVSSPPYRTTWKLSGTPDGDIELGFVVIDNAGNDKTNPDGTRHITMDSKGPEITWKVPEIRQWYSSDQKISWSLADGGGVDGFRQRWDNGAYSDLLHNTQGFLMLSWAKEGKHQAWVKAKDGFGNEREHDNGWWGYDTVAPLNPEAAINDGAPFTSSREVVLRLNVTDATSGPDQMQLRNENGVWSGWVSYAPLYRWTLSSGDGTKVVQVTFRDKALNESQAARATILLDTVAPANPTNIRESACSDIQHAKWQRTCSDPHFAWTDGRDDQSGLAGYEVKWNGTSHFVTTTDFDPVAVSTGSYQLEIRTRDKAGNVSADPEVFTFNFDNTPPTMPTSATELNGVQRDSWQGNVSSPSFSWSSAMDSGAGVSQYFVYWGVDSNGVPLTSVSLPAFIPPSPIQQESESVFYLRASGEDAVGNRSQAATLFTFKYDGRAPVGGLSINGGSVDTLTAAVILRLDVQDDGSGVKRMRISSTSGSSSLWQPFQPSIDWQLRTIHGITQTVYAEVADAVGNVSQVLSASIRLNLYPRPPQSQDFWIPVSVIAAGGECVGLSLNRFRLCGTVGQGHETHDTVPMVSTSFRLMSGYWALFGAVPSWLPPEANQTLRLDWTVVGSTAVGPTPLSSGRFLLQGTLGQTTEIARRNGHGLSYQLVPGFWALFALAPTASPTAVPTDTSTPTVSPVPTPSPTATASPTSISSPTASPTDFPSATGTPTDTPTMTPSPTTMDAPSATPTPTSTYTPTPTDTPVPTPKSQPDNAWGKEDDDTSDVFGDDWSERRFGVQLADEIAPADRIILYLRARAEPVSGSGLPYDYFGTTVEVNGVRGHYRDFSTWSSTVIYGTNFDWYAFSLPADLNGDGVSEWAKGLNDVSVQTWSNYNDEAAKTGVDVMYMEHIHIDQPADPHFLYLPAARKLSR